LTTLSLRGVSRSYGQVQALHDVDLDVRPGRVHAVLGENGAGKSTAIRLLAGLETPDSGTVELDGVPLELSSRFDAIRAGIGLVPQAGSLVGELDLVDNLALAQPWRVVRRRRATALLREAAAGAGIAVDLTAPARSLGLAQQRLGELALALAQGGRVLLLDEPTSTLGAHEIGDLFARLRKLADSGVGILLITHRLAEVRAVADTATVLSHGRVCWQGAVDGVDDAALAHAMVGDLPAGAPRKPRRFTGDSPAGLVLDGVSAVSPGDRVPLHDVSLRVRAGEVLAVIGTAGNGQRALAETAAGLVRPHSGSRQAAGPAAYIPESRLDALLPDLPAKWSAVLTRLHEPRFARFGVVRLAEVSRFARELFAKFDVRPPEPELPIAAFSGGNQQKLLLGREFDGDPAVVVLHGPTQGLDLRAAQAVREDVLRAAEAGAAILLVSADLDEVGLLADRVLVIDAGRIVEEHTAADFDRVVRRLTSPASEPTC
jgi:simple sugar transport system ATP-binding protein